MKTHHRTIDQRRQGGYTMAEMLLAIALMGVLFLANTSAIYFARITNYKDHDSGIVSDFLGHYAEQCKSLPFNEVATNCAINGLYNGVNGAPNIRIPSTTNWFSISTADYAIFHPDLVWLTNRSPEMRVTLETTTLAGAPHIVHLSMEARWVPPLKRGGLLTRRLDMVRVQDL